MDRIVNLNSRTLEFTLKVISSLAKVNKTYVNKIFLSQLVRSASSIVSNYAEACEAISPKEKRMKMSICRKEAKESTYWISLLEKTNKSLDLRDIYNESVELTKIFATIVNKL
jgi:four helix bundle protein